MVGREKHPKKTIRTGRNPAARKEDKILDGVFGDQDLGSRRANAASTLTQLKRCSETPFEQVTTPLPPWLFYSWMNFKSFDNVSIATKTVRSRHRVVVMPTRQLVAKFRKMNHASHRSEVARRASLKEEQAAAYIGTKTMLAVPSNMDHIRARCHEARHHRDPHKLNASD